MESKPERCEASSAQTTPPPTFARRRGPNKALRAEARLAPSQRAPTARASLSDASTQLVRLDPTVPSMSGVAAACAGYAAHERLYLRRHKLPRQPNAQRHGAAWRRACPIHPWARCCPRWSGREVPPRPGARTSVANGAILPCDRCGGGRRRSEEPFRA